MKHLDGVPHRVRRFRKQQRYMDDPPPGACVLWAATAELPRAAELPGTETVTRVARTRRGALRALDAAVRERRAIGALIGDLNNTSAAAIRAAEATIGKGK